MELLGICENIAFGVAANALVVLDLGGVVTCRRRNLGYKVYAQLVPWRAPGSSILRGLLAGGLLYCWVEVGCILRICLL